MENGTVPVADGAASPIRLADPHYKAPLTTPIGRLVERASYTDLIAAGIFALLLSTIYFALAPAGHSLNEMPTSYLDAAYFSFVTFTSLGYGDLSPVGFGRIVAVAVVIFGLASIALLVGKFASERQQAILLLLHTSDCQRRLNDFTSEIAGLGSSLESAATEREPSRVKVASRDLSDRVEAVSNYLLFNANQARLMAFGNESSLMALYLGLAKIQRICIAIHKAEKSDLLVSRRTRSIANRCTALVTLMRAFHAETVHQTSYLGALIRRVQQLRKAAVNEPSVLVQRVTTILTTMSLEQDLLKKWSFSGYTPAVCQQVWDASPSGAPATWDKGIHKQLAKKLNISNRLAQRCLDELLKSGRLPRAAVQKKEHTFPARLQLTSHSTPGS